MEVTKNELIEILSNVNKSTFINLTTLTNVTMNSFDNPYFGRVTKLSNCNYLIGNSYGKRVNNNYKKESLNEEFKTERILGRKHKTLCVLTNETEDQFYLMVERFNEIKPINTYYFDGNEIEYDVIKKYLKGYYEPQKQKQTRKVYPLTFKIDNILKCSLGNENYFVVD